MDRFFSQKYCDRCRGDLKNGRTMSMFNEECICMECATKEISHDKYKDAVDADCEEIKKGNYNFKGIGYKEDK